jgi:enamine deaminase RidA (YjgF/YER057c/UK114 family)
MSAEAKIAELGLQLPEAPKPGGNYTPVVQIGDLCYVSGHGPLTVEGTMLTGRVGSEVSQEDGYAAARQAASVPGQPRSRAADDQSAGHGERST